MNLKSQGLAFAAVAWLAVATSPWLPSMDARLQLAVLAPLILLLGVPHGALDIIFVRQLTRIQSMAAWSLFSVAYLALALAVGVLWWWSPGVFLTMFLLVSAFHFSGDPEGQTSAAFRALYGGAIIFCPLALHAAQVTPLFSALAGNAVAQSTVAALQWAAWPWVVAMVLAALAGARQNMVRSIELVSVAALLVIAAPLVAFTLFFCAMHSARHVLRTRDYANAGSLRSLLRIALWPMLATLVGVVIAWWLSDATPMDTRLVQLLFVGLAALTVPHMVVVERVRLSGWRLGRSAPR